MAWVSHHKAERVPLSPQNTIKKSRQACLNAVFLLCSATPRRRRGGMCKGAKRLRKSLRVRDSYCRNIKEWHIVKLCATR